MSKTHNDLKFGKEMKMLMVVEYVDTPLLSLSSMGARTCIASFGNRFP